MKKIVAIAAAAVGLATLGGFAWGKITDKKNENDAAEFVTSPEK